MEVRNMTEENVEVASKLFDDLKKQNPELSYETFREPKHSDSLDVGEVRDLRKQVDELNETICDVHMLLKHVFGNYVLIDGKFQEFGGITDGGEEEVEGTEETTPVTVGDGGFANMDAFKESLPEELRNSEIIKNATDMGSIAKMAVDSSSKVGQKIEDFLGSIPKNGDDPTAVDKAYSALGWPGADGKYDVTRPEKVDGIEYNEDQEAAFLEVAKELRLNPTQVNALVNMQNEFTKAQLATDLEEATASNEALKTAWGDKYEANKTEVKAILERSGDDSLVKLFNDTELGSHAGFIKLIHSLGAGMIEKGAVGAGDAPLQGAIAKDEAQKQIAANYKNDEFMAIYKEEKHPEYAAKRDEMYKLHQIVYGTADALA